MKISIIIPVYNNLVLTLNCLESLAGSSYYCNDSEVIIVDDGSDDGTEAYFTKVRPPSHRLVYHRNPGNLKFAGACNTGAKLARSEYLIFLNNDTIVTQNWDKHLLAVLENDRDAWIAGAKLLYPDRTLQHAGVYIPELSPVSFGHVYNGFPSCFPPANLEKELLCVTAACLAIRKEDFDRLGGFDEIFQNGGEDIDLCLKVIQKGKKIIYQPLCEIIHLESMSEGRFDRSVNNAALLYDRWIGKVKPDLYDRIEKELNLCKNKALIHEISRSSSYNNWHNGLNVNPLSDVMQEGDIQLGPSAQDLILQLPENTPPGAELFLDIQCRADEKIPVRLYYETRSGYRNEKILTTVNFVYKGDNHLLFWIKENFMKNAVAIRLDKPGSRIAIASFTFYTFQNPSKKRPVVTILYHNADQLFIDEIKTVLNSYPGIEYLFTGLGKESDPKELNELISCSEASYILVLGCGMRVIPEFIINAVEIMELQSGIGFIYSDIGIKKGNKDKTVGFDFNPETILLKNKPDMYGIFRKAGWKTIKGYDENIRFFPNTDLFIGILATGLWKSHHITYIAFQWEEINNDPAQDYLAESAWIRNKHNSFLLKKKL